MIRAMSTAPRPEETHFATPLPGGGSISAHRRVTRLSGGLTWIEEEMEVHGRLSGAFATGPGWIFELHRVSEGSVSYMQDGERVPVESRSFALLYAPFSITELVLEDVKTRWLGVAGEDGSAPGPRDGPVLFDVGIDVRLTTPSEIRAFLDTRREVRSFERSTRPSPFSRRAKAMLDASYRSTPSLASLAADLGVSHPHLTRQFKREFGLTPMAYRHALRASEAAGRLALGEPILDVSGEVGYEDLGRFYKSFRKAMHASPGACRLPEIGSKSAKTIR
jgi:AraC-like DNA-binding protein